MIDGKIKNAQNGQSEKEERLNAQSGFSTR